MENSSEAEEKSLEFQGGKPKMRKKNMDFQSVNAKK